jgi:hypothetical protein
LKPRIKVSFGFCRGRNFESKNQVEEPGSIVEPGVMERRLATAAAAAAAGLVIFAAVCTSGRGSLRRVELQGDQGFPGIRSRDRHGWAPSSAPAGEDSLKEGGEEGNDENGEMTPEHQVVHGNFLDMFHHLLSVCLILLSLSLSPSLSLSVHFLLSLSLSLSLSLPQAEMHVEWERIMGSTNAKLKKQVNSLSDSVRQLLLRTL